jgi:hypothetical protein
MHTRVNRNDPALKHGAYSATAVLPGESRAVFEKLHRDLIAELTPSGVLEEDIVTTMARLVWRKQNLGTLRTAELAQDRCSALRLERLNAKIEMAILEDFDPAKREEEKRAAEDRARKELGNIYELAETGEAATFDGLTKELDIKERLDASIARCLKQLLLVRGVKSISAAPPSASPKHLPGPSKAA